MSWDYFTHARTLELLYHKLQSPVLARYQMTQIELDVLLFLANHPGLDTAKDIVEIRRLTKSHVSAAVEGLSRKGYLLRVRRPDNRKLIHLTLLPEAAPVVADGHAGTGPFPPGAGTAGRPPPPGNRKRPAGVSPLGKGGLTNGYGYF